MHAVCVFENGTMKARSDSLFATLERDGKLDAFFGFVATAAPSYAEMLDWFAGEGYRTSMGAVHNLVTYHMGVWRARQAVAASAEAVADLPPDADEKLRERIRTLKFDLTMRDLSVQQQLAVWKLDQVEREMAAKNRSARDLAVDALLAEAQSNDEAKAALGAFLAALERGRETGDGDGGGEDARSQNGPTGGGA